MLPNEIFQSKQRKG